MALLGSKRIHLIITDSRGKGLGDLISTRNNTGELYDVLVREGTSLFDLVEVAVKHLHKNPFDVVYIVGGACDITFKEKTTKRIVYAWRKGELESHLLEVLNNANKRMYKEFPASKVVFCPLIASELARVVNHGVTTQENQHEVEEAVWEFNSNVFKINKERGVVSPSLHHQVHRYCKRKRRNYYHHLDDGIHLSEYLLNKWADEFATVMAHN